MLTVLCFNLLGDGRARHPRSPHANMTKSLLALNDLHVTFSTRRGLVEAVRGVTLSLGEGEMLGLVGESGSGKSVTGFAITRLLDARRAGHGGQYPFSRAGHHADLAQAISAICTARRWR